jgi:hypothetical protein
MLSSYLHALLVSQIPAPSTPAPTASANTSSSINFPTSRKSLTAQPAPSLRCPPADDSSRSRPRTRTTVPRRNPGRRLA